MKEEQTAVEWLRKELEKVPNYSAFYTNNYQWIDSIMNQALKYEDEQSDKARTNGFNFAKNLNQ
jgi:hypothetical protein